MRRSSATSCAPPASTPSGSRSSATRPGRRSRRRSASSADPAADMEIATTHADAAPLGSAGNRSLLGRIEAGLGSAIEAIAALLVAAEIVVLFAGVVARYVLHRPLTWSDELAS